MLTKVPKVNSKQGSIDILIGVLFPQVTALSLGPQHYILALARAAALISKVGHLGGWGWGLGRGWGHELERLQLVKESLRLQWAPKTHTARFQ